MNYDVLIVGAGHAGSQAAIALRQRGFEGSIAMVGDESEIPYERPPLSKEYLAGEKPFERLLIRQPIFWEERNIAMLTGRLVTAVDADAHAVEAAEGRIGYGKLIWATGGRARKLPCVGGDLTGVHTVRTRADADRMIAELDGTTRAVVIGGGYIGLEAAAVLTKLGKQVTLIEALDRVLARVAGPELSRFYEDEHRARGVDVRLGTGVADIEGANAEGGGRVTGVRLTTGELLPCEMVIVGIGIVAAVEPLVAAGAAGTNGVDVDVHCRTSLPDIYAIGDCAAHVSRFADGLRVRVESVQNANDQANVAARDIIGDPVSYDATPWFWSNQYDLKLQSVGLNTGYDASVVRGDPASRSFSVVYLRGGQVVAIDCVNMVKDYVQGRKLIEAGAHIDPDRLADANVPLKELA